MCFTLIFLGFITHFFITRTILCVCVWCARFTPWKWKLINGKICTRDTFFYMRILPSRKFPFKIKFFKKKYFPQKSSFRLLFCAITIKRTKYSVQIGYSPFKGYSSTRAIRESRTNYWNCLGWPWFRTKLDD